MNLLIMKVIPETDYLLQYSFRVEGTLNICIPICSADTIWQKYPS